MDTVETKNFIESGQAIPGIEFGSTRIKAVLINRNHIPIASGAHDLENRLENGIWTYTLDDIWSGVQKCYADMCDDVYKKYGVDSYIANVASIILSSTETVFYTMSVYFMTAKVTKTRWTLPGALFATLAGTIASVMVAKLM